MYSLIVSCKLNDVDPQAWLADVLARLPDHRKRAVGTAGTLLRRADLGRCSARCPFNSDDFFEAFDAEDGEGGHAILTDAVNPKATVFGLQINVEVPQPFFVFPELLGDVLEREDV